MTYATVRILTVGLGVDDVIESIVKNHVSGFRQGETFDLLRVQRFVGESKRTDFYGGRLVLRYSRVDTFGENDVIVMARDAF